jgi:surface polysaccharide O-acyltransferase-like enzyme
LLPYWIANGVSGLSFFVLGYAMRDSETKWWLIVPCVLVYSTGCIAGFPIVDMWSNDLDSGNYFLWIPVALCCIVVFNAVCLFIYQYFQIKLIEMVGQNAMIIYVTYCLIYQTIRSISDFFDIQTSDVGMFSIILVAYVLILPLCVKLSHKSRTV